MTKNAFSYADRTKKGPVRSALICFVGMDGSGKTTLSSFLHCELVKNGYDAVYRWWLEVENSPVRRVLRKIAKKSSEKSPRQQEILTSTGTNLFALLYPKIVLIDYVQYGISQAWLPKHFGKNKVIIFDRYIYDIIIALAKEFNYSPSRTEKEFKCWSKLLPAPDLIFAVDVPPRIAYQRKKEEIGSEVDAKEMWTDYQDMMGFVSSLIQAPIVKIDNTKDPELAKASVWEATIDYLQVKARGN